jgi:hypothetical protein
MSVQNQVVRTTFCMGSIVLLLLASAACATGRTTRPRPYTTEQVQQSFRRVGIVLARSTINGGLGAGGFDWLDQRSEPTSPAPWHVLIFVFASPRDAKHLYRYERINTPRKGGTATLMGNLILAVLPGNAWLNVPVRATPPAVSRALRSLTTPHRA